MDKVIHWLREKAGFYMLNAHIDGVMQRMDEQDKKIKELEIEIRILKGIKQWIK